jgi:HAMP domain-containing protein
MTYSAKIRFISEPEGYVREVLIPQIQGASCDGDVCQFPYAKELYGLNLVFMLVGAVLLLILGYFMASILAFPSGPILKLRQSISQTIHSLRCPQAPTQETLDGKPTEELEEVRTERETVREIIRPLLSEPESESTEVEGFSPALNYSVIPREEIPPVMISRLRKVYPALGGGNKPKVALKSLDMHVPKVRPIYIWHLLLPGKTRPHRYVQRDKSSAF